MADDIISACCECGEAVAKATPEVLACCDKCLWETCNTCCNCWYGDPGQGTGNHTYCFFYGNNTGNCDCCPEDRETQKKCLQCCACTCGLISCITGGSAVAGYLVQQGTLHVANPATAAFLTKAMIPNAAASMLSGMCGTCCAEEVHRMSYDSQSSAQQTLLPRNNYDYPPSYSAIYHNQAAPQSVRM